MPGREKYAQANNLVLEFYFEDQYLEEKVDGQGLVLEPRVIPQRILDLGIDKGERPTTEPHYRRIVRDSKKPFAEKVVPTLPTKAFSHFQALFIKVQAAIKTLSQMREQ